MTAVAVPDRVREALLALAPPRCAYVYDTTVLRDTVLALREALPDRVRLLYAVKANAHTGVLAELAAVVDGFEVASGGELALVRDLVGPYQTVAFSGPGKTPVELAEAVAAGVTVHAESLLELRRLGEIAAATRALGDPVRPVVALRVNRAGATPGGSHQMTGVPTPFGLDESGLGDAVALATALGLDLRGFHLHAVSNSLDAQAYAQFVESATTWTVDAADRYALPLRYLNVGGGLGIDYTYEQRFDPGVLTDGLNRAVAQLPREAALVLEPGRFLAADAGWYAAEVLDLKRVHGRWFAVIRGGTHHFRLPAAWGYSHPCGVVAAPDWPHAYPRPSLVDTPLDVVGELCTPRDVLARDQHLGEVRVGDLIVLPRTGAYGWEISHHQFLRHDPPRFVLL
jgi:diaminopimelate decarboxylase